MSRLLHLHHLDSFAPTALSSLSIFSSLLCTFNAWKTELSGFQNLAFSCLATVVSGARRLKAGRTISILLGDGRIKRGKEGRYCAILKIICPEVQARLFNHTTDYAITVRWPAEEEGGNWEPGATLTAVSYATCPAFCSHVCLQCITAVRQLPSSTLMSSREIMREICLQTRNSIKVKCVIR